jgi:hypothetical protein
MISTRDLSLLPDVSHLKALMQSLAMLDSILMNDWEYRYYSFDSNWNKNSAVASMRDGEGDELFAMFMPFGAILKGFAHESAMSPYRVNPPNMWHCVLDNVPSAFSEFLSEPAFSPLDTTFCIWRMGDDSMWKCGNIDYPDEKDPDGSEDLLAILDGKPKTYQIWAEKYYNQAVDLAAVKQIYEHQPLTEELITVINSKTSIADVLKESVVIGYPKAGG